MNETTALESKRMDLGIAAVLIGVLAMTMLPLPTPFIDLLLSASLCLAVIVLLVSVYIERPLDFSSFPSLLLFVTLLRLALNVATSRVILTHGGEGAGAAGRVIEAFGKLAVGGNFVVGLVVFLILIIVNFIVITKGAERISEVSARFILDAMPGKQMAIDAELSAGLINEGEARARRQKIEAEADFYGAMDGASKFVRGDAVAGLLVVGIDILGGFIVGVAQHGMPIGDAARTFTILTVGDGLVTQIPALLISLSAGLITTRASAAGSLGGALSKQLLSRPRPLGITAVLLGALALVPGMPHLAFTCLAALTAMGARRAQRHSGAPSQKTPLGLPSPTETAPSREEDSAALRKELEKVLYVDPLALEIGLDLLPLVDTSRNGELLTRISSVRKQLAAELGLLVPPIHVRDDLKLPGGSYRVLLSGIEVARGSVRMGKLLAIDPTGTRSAGIDGETVEEPAFGLPAKWVALSERRRAEIQGCTVVEPAVVVATHLTEVIRKHAHELLSRREAQDLLELCSRQNGKLVEELIPHLLPQGDVIKVLKNLLREGVSIRDMRSILETLAEHAGAIKDVGELTELVRQRLCRQITAAHKGDAAELRVMVLDPRTEDVLRQRSGPTPDPRALSHLATALEHAAKDAAAKDEPMVLLVAPEIRRKAAAVAMRHAPGLSVLSYREVDPQVPLVTQQVVGHEEVLAA